MCAGGTPTANSDSRESVQSGRRQHHVKECVRDHGSGDVVGIITRTCSGSSSRRYWGVLGCVVILPMLPTRAFSPERYTPLTDQFSSMSWGQITTVQTICT